MTGLADFTILERCRICGGKRLEPVLDLGEQVLTGVFPKTSEEEITKGPLRLVKCIGKDRCGLLQLQHNYPIDQMYGENYGYRSGLNRQMVAHLTNKVSNLLARHEPPPGSLIVDIGSNDGTTLRGYPPGRFQLVGVDPSGQKFRRHYRYDAELIPHFFTEATFRQHFPDKSAAIVTSLAMLYDLPDPLLFMRDVRNILQDGGLWIFEQSYMPTMLERTAYDTVCHEHLEYYALEQIVWMVDRIGFSILDVSLNDVNGGSFSVLAQRSERIKHADVVSKLLEEESRRGLGATRPYLDFSERVSQSRSALQSFLGQCRNRDQRVCGLGASTKGNVILQYCDIDRDLVSCVGEVNEDKFGHFTPGTNLPIRAESEVLAEEWHYHLVLPWHFREFFLWADQFAGKTLVFPLPELAITNRC